jgi:hypothetical protein
MKKCPNRTAVFALLPNGIRVPRNRKARRELRAEFRSDIRRAKSQEEREVLREVRDELLGIRRPSSGTAAPSDDGAELAGS